MSLALYRVDNTGGERLPEGSIHPQIFADEATFLVLKNLVDRKGMRWLIRNPQ
jgi:hypothetical protein